MNFKDYVKFLMAQKPDVKLSHHKLPTNRRELLGQGLINAAGFIAMPSILSLVAREARGEALTCSGGAAGAGSIPFIVVDLGGGGNIPGANVIVGASAQTDYLPDASYGTIGLSPAIAPGNAAMTGLINTEFGLAFHPQSRFLAQMLATTQVTTRAKVDGGIFAAVSGDDTNTNPHNPMYWIAKAGAKGEAVSLIGSDDSISGGRAAAPTMSINSAISPTRINTPADAVNLLQPGALATLLGGKTGINRVFKASQNLSDARLAKLNQQSINEQLRSVLLCAHTNANKQLTGFTPADADASQDPDVTNLFNMNNGEERTAASIVNFVLKGFAGAGTISLGGFDYHGNDRTNTDQADAIAGTIIGKALELAALKGKDLMIYVFTDGGVSCQADAGNMASDGLGRYNPTSDNGVRSSAFTLVYKAQGTGRPALRTAGRQIGTYNTAGAVADGLLTSNSVENLSRAIVANYLALSGREGELKTVVDTDPFGAALQNYLLFQKLA